MTRAVLGRPSGNLGAGEASFSGFFDGSSAAAENLREALGLMVGSFFLG
jgi:hypothetical protein